MTFTEQVNVQLSGRHSEFFTFTRSGNEITILLRNDIGFDQLPNAHYLQLSISAASEGLTSASANIIVGRIYRQEQSVKFGKSVYIGSIDNQKQLNLEIFELLTDSVLTHVLLSGEDSIYFGVTVERNNVLVTLQANITEDLLLRQNILIFQVLASTDAGVSVYANVIVTLPRINDDKILRFEKSAYIGSYDALSSSIDIEKIILELSNYDNSVQFKLEQQDAEIFSFTREFNVITLTMRTDFNRDLLNNKVFLSLNIKAERNDFASAQSLIFIQLPVKVEEIEFIYFTKPTYRGTVDFQRTLNFEEIHLLPDPEDDRIEVSLKGDDADKFVINRNKNALELQVNPSGVFQPNTPLHFHIEALKIGTPKTFASILIEFIDRKILSFEELKNIGKLDNNFELIIDPIPLTDDMKSNDVTLQLKDGDHNLFSVEKTNSEIIIRTYEVNESILNNKQILWFYLVANGAAYYEAETLILIELSPWSSVPIEECYDTSDPSQPFFETGSYSFTLTSEEKGFIGRVRALIIDTQVLEYSLLIDDEYLTSKISVNTLNGDLMISSSIPSGIYRFVAQATNTESLKTAAARVTLRVIEARECLEDVQTTIEKVLAIEHLEENTVYPNIIPSIIDNCQYQIINVVPSGYRGENIF